MEAERLKPLLGTFVRIRASWPGTRRAPLDAALDLAFGEIARIHRSMSFQDPQSQLSELNRGAAGEAMAIGPEMVAVLSCALDVAEASDGAFDPTLGGLAVAEGLSPAPAGAPPDTGACWRDLDLDAGSGTLRFRRPLWLDLSGIAKGYAVDLAVRALVAAGMEAGVVEAGGDLRVFGTGHETVGLDCQDDAEYAIAVELSDAALASSAGETPREASMRSHFDGADRGRRVAGFATVVAPSATLADALTKVVLAQGDAARSALERFGAWAVWRNPEGAWSRIGAAA